MSLAKQHITRHTMRKHPIDKTVDQPIVTENHENDTKNPENYENVTENEVNATGCSETQSDNKCSKCLRVLSTKKTLKGHMKVCKGTANSLQCHNCFEIFMNHWSKSRHLKKCLPHVDIPEEVIEEPTPEQVDIYKKKCIPQSVRITVWDTYIGISIGQTHCYVCKTNLINQFNFHCGHVIAEKNGGSCEITNLRPICKSCNSSMRTTNLEDYKLKYFNNCNNIVKIRKNE
jgi:hypothetical protein